MLRTTLSPARSAPAAPDRVAAIPSGAIALGLGLVVALVLIAGMAVASAPIMLVGAAAALGTAIIWPMSGLVVLSLTASLVPPPVIPSPGFDTVLVVALLLGCVFRLPIERPRFTPAIPLVLVLVFVAYVFVQQLPEMVAGYPGQAGLAAGYLFTELATGAGAVVAAGLILRGQSPAPVVTALLISASLAAFLALVSGGDPASAPSLLRNLMGQSTEEGRAMGPFVNPNYYGSFMAFSIVLAVSLLWGRTSDGAKLLLAVSIPFLSVGLVLSASRGAFATLLAGLAAVAFVKSTRLGASAAVAGILIVLIGYPMFLEWRVATENEGITSMATYMHQADSDVGRFGAVATVPLVLERSPIFGVGPGQFPSISAQVTPGSVPIETHNWFLQVLTEQGIVGFIIWLTLLASVAVKLRSTSPTARSIGVGTLAAFAVASVFLQPPASYQLCAVPIVILVASLVARWPDSPDPAATPAPEPAKPLGRPRPAARYPI